MGLLLADPRGALHVVAASSERVADLEAFQVQREQGPCHTCSLDGQPVTVPDLAASAHAVSMRLRDAVVGALNLFGATPGSLEDSDLRLAQAWQMSPRSPSSETEPPQTGTSSTSN